MITAALLSLLASGSAPERCPEPTAGFVQRGSQEAEIEAKIRAAGVDTAALLALAKSCQKTSETAASKRCFERILELDPDHQTARKALRHHRYSGKWFETYVALSRFKREEDERMKAKGLVRWQNGWIKDVDLPFVRMGFVRDEEQGWAHPADLAGAREVLEWKAAGYKFRADDSTWVAADDFDKWTRVLWKCGEDWLDTAAADAFHSKLVTPWKLTGDYFEVLTTCAWNYGNAARWHADRTHKELLRLFGTAPDTRPSLLVLNSLVQYNAASADDRFRDAEGFSSLHGAYFCDSSLDSRQKPARYSGTGVSYWESGNPKVASWGPFWVRWAAAQSFVEAIDPSWVAVSGLVVDKGEWDPQAYGTAFWREKIIPRWLRYGAASYVERYLANPEASEGTDPWNLRAFALSQLKEGGGLRKLSEVFAFPLKIEDVPGSTRLYNEAGLIVAFLLDGSADDAELRAVHRALRSALAAGAPDKVRAACKALEAALAVRSEAIRAFAGL